MKPELLIAYLDRELSPEEEKQVEVELNADPELRRFLSELYYHRFLFVEAHQKGAIQPQSTALPELKQKSSSVTELSTISLSRPSWVLIAASLLIFFILYFYPHSQTFKSVQVASVKNSSQEIKILRGDKRMAATAGMEILNQDILITPPDGTITLQRSDGSLIKLQPKSILTFDTTQQNVPLLKTGALTAKINHQPSDQPIYFFTPHGKVEVIGTQFFLNTHSHAGTGLRMIDGKVKLTKIQDQQTLEISKSQWAYIPRNGDLASGQGTLQIFKNGKVLLDKSASLHLKPIHKKTRLASMNLPGIQKLPHKALAVELDYMMNHLDDGKFNVAFFSKGKAVTDYSSFPPYFYSPILREDSWAFLRLELEQFAVSHDTEAVHVTVYRNNALIGDHWINEIPDTVSLAFSDGDLHVKNFKILELVPETFE